MLTNETYRLLSPMSSRALRVAEYCTRTVLIATLSKSETYKESTVLVRVRVTSPRYVRALVRVRPGLYCFFVRFRFT